MNFHVGEFESVSTIFQDLAVGEENLVHGTKGVKGTAITVGQAGRVVVVGVEEIMCNWRGVDAEASGVWPREMRWRQKRVGPRMLKSGQGPRFRVGGGYLLWRMGRGDGEWKKEEKIQKGSRGEDRGLVSQISESRRGGSSSGWLPLLRRAK